ncbi:MAG: GNAT family N-acetyltransferase [Myxococcales bacterium]|jgi:GNAT superfamily N-acetyltransferase
MTADIDTISCGEHAELDAWKGIWAAVPAHVRDRFQLSLDVHGSAVVCRALGVPTWFFNRVMGVGLDGPADLGWIESQVRRFRETDTPHGVSICRDGQAPQLGTWLERQGLRHTTTLAKMMRTTDDPPTPSPDVAIELAARADGDRFGAAAARGFGMPTPMADWFARLPGRDGLHVYLALDGDDVVGTGVLSVQGEVGWLGFGATLPEHRGKGVHRALMARRVRDAVELGCRWLVTETNQAQSDEPTPSLDNMKRNGFELAYERLNYVS